MRRRQAAHDRLPVIDHRPARRWHIAVAMHELDRVRAIVRELPEVTERHSHGEPCFFIRNDRALCDFHDHHNDDRVALWCPPPSGAADELASAEPARFFKPRPPHAGPSPAGSASTSTQRIRPNSTGPRFPKSSRTPTGPSPPNSSSPHSTTSGGHPLRRPPPGRPASSRGRTASGMTRLGSVARRGTAPNRLDIARVGSEAQARRLIITTASGLARLSGQRPWTAAIAVTFVTATRRTSSMPPPRQRTARSLSLLNPPHCRNRSGSSYPKAGRAP